MAWVPRFTPATYNVVRSAPATRSKARRRRSSDDDDDQMDSSDDDDQHGGSGAMPASKRRCVQRSASGHSSRYAGIGFVGKRITVFWEADDQWYSGTIKEYNPAGDDYLVLYDDGVQASEDLDDCTWDFEGEQPANGAGTVADEVPTQSDAGQKLQEPTQSLVTEAHGLKLHLSKSGSTGYLHVYPVGERFRARVKGAKQGDLGVFDSAVEAAVAVAKKLLEPTQSLVTEAQGLKLHLSSRGNNTTGYRGVSFEPDRNVFRAMIGKARLGTFKTAVEAAVAVARHLQEKEEQGMVGVEEDEDEDEDEEDEEEEVELVTEAEGLELHLSSRSRTGYLHVTVDGSRFRANVNGKHLGSFATVVESAVAVARHLQEEEGEEEEEELVTEAKGLKLHLSSKSRTGYLHVIDKGSRFRAMAGKHHYLGSFATAVEAATAVARWYLQRNRNGSEGDDEVEEDKEDEDEDVEVVTEAEGLKLRLSGQNKTGYLHVTRTKSSRFRAEVKGHGPRGAPLNLGHYGTAVEAAVAVARHLQAAEEAAMEEESEEDELEIKEDEVEIEVEDEEEIKEVAEQPVPEEQPGPLPDPPPPQQLPGQPPGQQPESPPQLEVEEQPQPQRLSLGVAVLGSAPGSSTGGVAVLSLGQRLVQLESRLGTDAPQGANVLQRIKTLEANMDVTAIGSMPDRITALEAKAAEWFV